LRDQPKPLNEKSQLKETPETLHYAALIKKLSELNHNAQQNINMNQWTIKSLKVSRKKALKEANKK